MKNENCDFQVTGAKKKTNERRRNKNRLSKLVREPHKKYDRLKDVMKTKYIYLK